MLQLRTLRNRPGILQHHRRYRHAPHRDTPYHQPPRNHTTKDHPTPHLRHGRLRHRRFDPDKAVLLGAGADILRIHELVLPRGLCSSIRHKHTSGVATGQGRG